MSGRRLPSRRMPTSKRECARDSVVDVDPMRIKVRIDNHSEAPLEHWRDRLKRRRRKDESSPGQPEAPVNPEHQPPDSLIDDYAAPPPG